MGPSKNVFFIDNFYALVCKRREEEFRACPSKNKVADEKAPSQRQQFEASQQTFDPSCFVGANANAQA